MRPAALRPYAPGRAAHRTGKHISNLALPTAEIVADTAFQRAHCFRYAGPDTAAARAAHRVEFSPAQGLDRPDLSGALWLDAATGIA